MSFPKRNITGVINVEIECALYLCIFVSCDLLMLTVSLLIDSLSMISLICVLTCNCCFLSARSKSEQWSWALCDQDTRHLKNFWILSHMKQQLGTRRGIYWNLLIVNLDVVKFCWHWKRVNISHQLTGVWWMCALACEADRDGMKQKTVMGGEWLHRFSSICLNVFWFWNTNKIYIRLWRKYYSGL